MNAFINFCDAVASWAAPAADLYQEMRAILHTFKSHMTPEAWQQYYGAFPEALRNRLTEQYQL